MPPIKTLSVKSGASLFVTGIPEYLPKSKILQLFEQCGNLVHSRVVPNKKYPGQVVAYVSFENPESAMSFRAKYHEKDAFGTGFKIYAMENKNTTISTDPKPDVYVQQPRAKTNVVNNGAPVVNLNKSIENVLQPSPCLAISGIPEFVTRDQIKQLFGQHGHILRMYVGKDKFKEEQQHAFITFKNKSSADLVKTKYENTDPFNWGSGINLFIKYSDPDKNQPRIGSTIPAKIQKTSADTIPPPKLGAIPSNPITIPAPNLDAIPPPKLGAIPPPRFEIVQPKAKISAPPIAFYSPMKGSSSVKSSNSNDQVAVSNSDYGSRILQSIQISYLKQQKGPLLNITVLHPGRGNTMARYAVNSQMMYSACNNHQK